MRNRQVATLYLLSMTYITVYNLSINSNYRILAAELNYRFTCTFSVLKCVEYVDYPSSKVWHRCRSKPPNCRLARAARPH